MFEVLATHGDTALDFDRVIIDLLADEFMAEHGVDRLDAPCHKCLADARCTPADIDQVLLVGGMTRMPVVQERAVQIEASSGLTAEEIQRLGQRLGA